MLDFFSSIGSAIMAPLYYVISALLIAFHKVLGGVFGPASGITWVLSIIGLTLVIRAALIPLFVKQIKSSRNMQLIQPKVRELQKQYGHDREKLAQETMKLYKDSGTNPFSSCLPILLQMPIFLGLFRLIDQAARKPHQPKGLMTEALNLQFRDATVFGGKISSTFVNADVWNVRGLALALVIAMTITTFLTQRQLMSKNMPADAMSGPYAQQQKMLLYVLPIVFAFGGIAFPIGVLFYWTTSNLWTMCQQFYVIRNNPAPGTPAMKAKEDRDRAKAARKGVPYEPDVIREQEAAEAEAKRQPRVQPERKPKSQRQAQQKPAQQKPSQPKSGPQKPGQQKPGQQRNKKKR